MMKRIILLLLVCAVFGCGKDAYKTLTSKNWVITSATVTPAMTINGKTSNNYMKLMGKASCVANMMFTFSNDGTYTFSSNGALCDRAATTDVKTWTRTGNKITLSADKHSPMTLNGETLSQTVTGNESGGIIYTFTYTYKAQSK